MPADAISRRAFVSAAGAAALAATLPAPLRGARRAPRAWRVYLGSYTTSGGGEGIYRCRLDAASGELRVEEATPAVDPSFLALDAPRRRLYAVNEVAEHAGQPGGAVSAFSVDPQTGALALLNQQSTRGAEPCHLALEPGGRCVLVANYGAGSAAVLPLAPDGSLRAASCVVQHTGRGPHPERQTAPHAHCVVPDAAGRHAFVVDLGIDRVQRYRLDADAGRLEVAPPDGVALPPGAGPRHLAFHPAGRLAFVANELDSTVAVLGYDEATAALRVLQTISTLPAGFSGENFPAELQVAPSGRFLYLSNRGHDSLAVFGIDAGRGQLTPLQHEPTGGAWPRHFALDPGGRLLLVANQRSGSLAAFRVDPASGRLSRLGPTAQVPAPVCVRFGPALAPP